jgi:hypothetical protein
VSIEKELLNLAREHEGRTAATLEEMSLVAPHLLQRQLRAYLSRQVDCDRMKRAGENVPLLQQAGDLSELICPKVKFTSDAHLEFKIQLETKQTGWQVTSLLFHVFLAPGRNINMVRIHLKPEAGHNPLEIPRCHMHIGRSRAHVPFPIMDPRLILHLICERIEPDFGA